MSLLNLFVAVFLSHFLSLYSFERTRMAHLLALTSLTLVVIRKSVHHIFGQHQHCSDFCRAKIQPPQHTQTDSTSCMSSCQPCIEETDLIEEQVDYWNEGSSIDLQEESRYGTSIDYQNVEKHIIKDVTLLLSKPTHVLHIWF
jgi:hypothetical protein